MVLVTIGWKSHFLSIPLGEVVWFPFGIEDWVTFSHSSILAWRGPVQCRVIVSDGKSSYQKYCKEGHALCWQSPSYADLAAGFSFLWYRLSPGSICSRTWQARLTRNPRAEHWNSFPSPTRCLKGWQHGLWAGYCQSLNLALLIRGSFWSLP